MLRSILLLPALVATLCAPIAPALAQTNPPQRDLTWSKSGHWIIAMDPGDNCAMIDSFDGGWNFGVAYSTERLPIALVVGPLPYKVGDNPALSWQIGQDAFSGGENRVGSFGGKPRITAGMPREFLDKIAAGTEIEIYEGDKKITGFYLTETAAAIAELRRCWGELIKEDKGTRLPAVTPPQGQNLATVIQTDDYPSAALREQASGRTGVALTITAHGLVSGCSIVSSSGNVDLDNAACRAMQRRARFTPAKDAAGKATEGRYQTGVNWTIPAD